MVFTLKASFPYYSICSQEYIFQNVDIDLDVGVLTVIY